MPKELKDEHLPGEFEETPDGQQPEEQQYPNIEGHWDWKNDGQTINGDIILKSGGVLEHANGWSGGYWKHKGDGKVFMQFNEIGHTMVLSEDKKNMLLIEPFRSPPTVATFNRAIGETPKTEGYWTEHVNIDMCGQGDMELVHDWKKNFSVDKIKQMVIDKGYSCFTVSNGNPSFPFAALKKFDF